MENIFQIAKFETFKVFIGDSGVSKKVVKAAATYDLPKRMEARYSLSRYPKVKLVVYNGSLDAKLCRWNSAIVDMIPLSAGQQTDLISMLEKKAR
ncbi:MAG: hypothetical protein FWD15_04130 [Alphaproteobacteria bacterium]|nr:hypothetical protein [Alphaproteobacteria bacterium]